MYISIKLWRYFINFVGKVGNLIGYAIWAAAVKCSNTQRSDQWNNRKLPWFIHNAECERGDVEFLPIRMRPLMSMLGPPILRISRSTQNCDMIWRHLLLNFSAFSLKSQIIECRLESCTWYTLDLCVDVILTRKRLTTPFGIKVPLSGN